MVARWRGKEILSEFSKCIRLKTGIVRGYLRLGTAFNCFQTLSFRGRNDLSRRGIARVLQVAVVSGQSPKGQGVQTTSTNVWVWSGLRGWAQHLHHSPESPTSRRGSCVGQRCCLEPPPASVLGEGLYPWPRQGIWRQDRSWWASVKLLEPWMETET